MRDCYNTQSVLFAVLVDNVEKMAESEWERAKTYYSVLLTSVLGQLLLIVLFLRGRVLLVEKCLIICLENWLMELLKKIFILERHIWG